MRTLKWKLLLLAASAVIALPGYGSADKRNDSKQSDPAVVTIEQGTLKGTVATGYRSFLGIPYAAPPTGDLRWKAPQAPASWSGVRDATAFGNRCPQVTTALGNPSSTNEDCLYLNVYTPVPPPHVPPLSHLPVLVWFHGGAFGIGAGSDYDGSYLASHNGLIVVTLNYRLGPFASLTLKGLEAEDPNATAGNYGIEDQQAVLRWVQANISKFGGDPRWVTIAGQSAGGASVCMHLVSPQSSGMFSRAIIQSGPCNATWAFTTHANASALGSNFAARPSLACSGTDSDIVSCMRSKSVAQIIGAETRTELGGFGSGFIPHDDGYLFSDAPIKLIAAGNFQKVPLLEGTTLDEGRLFTATRFDVSATPIPLNSDDYAQVVSQLSGLGSVAPLILSTYPLSNYATPSGYDPYTAPAHLALSAIFGDMFFSCPTRTLEQKLAASGIPMYKYEFRDPAPPGIFIDPLMPTGAAHATDLLYVFHAPVGTGAGLVSPNQFTPDQLALSTAMANYWAWFAITGIPLPLGQPYWPSLQRSGQLMGLAPGAGGIAPSDNNAFGTDHHCDFWAQLGI